MSYARERGMEREAVTDERSLMRDALKHTMGERTVAGDAGRVRAARAVAELIEVERRRGLRAARSRPARCRVTSAS
jgi:hypothetical protein